jgi:FkbM family methyltransferase
MEDDQRTIAQASWLASMAVAAIRLLPRGRLKVSRRLTSTLQRLGVTPCARRRIGPYRLTFDMTEPYEAMMALGVYEPEFVRLLRRVLRPGDTYVDAGAHLGFFAAEAGRRIGTTGRLFLFEPDARARSRLEAHLASAPRSRAPQTRLFPEALSDRSGDGRMGLLPVVGWSQVLRSDDTMETGAGRDTRPIIDIRLTTLDAVAEAEQIEHIRLLKIDVEGHEILLLRGARHTLDVVRPDFVLIEVNPEALAAHGFLGRHIHALLAHYGYRGVLMPQTRIGRSHWDPSRIVNWFYARTEALLSATLPGLAPAAPEEELTAGEIEAAWLEANDDDAPDVWGRRLVHKAAMGRVTDAKAEGLRLLGQYPDCWWFRGHLAHWLLQTGQIAEARAHYEQMHAEQPANAEVARILAQLNRAR